MSYVEGQDSERASEEDHERQSKKKDLILLGKKKEGKKEKKDRGYVMFDEEDSDESLVVSEDIKSPSKMKKSKPFKFPSKKSKEKDEKKDKDGKKDEKDKEKKKEEKEGKKHKIKGDKKKSKHGHLHSEPAQVIGENGESDKPIFGVPLTVAVERNKCHDGIELPCMLRECIDYIEEHGLSCEGIYRISGVKSKVQFLKDCYNKHLPVYLEEYEPNIVASLLKTFLRELPEPVLTTSMMPKFEEASVIKSEKKRVEQFLKLIDDLPVCNKTLLSWMIVHMKHVIERQKENKMSLQNVSIVLSPTMQISHRVLNILFSHVKQLFRDVELKKYKPPMKPTTSRWSLELPDNPAQLEEELAKQESLLNALHAELNTGITDQEKEEQLWEVQRIVTQLKRKIKFAKKSVDAAEKRRKEKEEKRPTSVAEEDELRLELREMPTKRHAPPPPTKITNQNEVVEGQIPTAKEANQKEVVEVHVSSNQVSDDKQQNISEDAKLDNDVAKADEKNEQEIDKNTIESQNIKNVEGASEEAEIVTEETTKVQEETKEEVDVTQKDVSEEKENDSVPVGKEEETPEKTKENDDQKEVQNETIEEKSEETQSVNKDAQAVAETTEKEIAVETTEKRVSFVESQTEDDDEVCTNYEDQFEQQVEDILEKVKGVKESSEESENESKDTVKQYVESAVEIKPIPEIQKPLAVSSNMNEFVTNGQIPVTDDDTDQLAEFKESLGVQDEEPTVYEPVDEEILALQEEQLALQLEEEELLAIERELRTKIETEKNETDRLQQEITELQYLRQDSDLEEFSSSSESSYESEDEDDLQEILNQLLSENEKLERENTELCQKIHEERMICLEVKVQIRVLQQKHLGNSLGSDGFIERDLMIF